MTTATVPIAAGLENQEDTMEGMFLTFTLSDQTYGLEIKHVIEIIGLQQITEVPDVAHFIKGVINLRGKVIPVMDVRARFGMEPRDYDDRTCIIVVTLSESDIGLIVDRVAEVLTIPDSQIQAPPSVGTDTAQKYMKGLGKIGSDVKILLDINKMVFEDGLLTIEL